MERLICLIKKVNSYILNIIGLSIIGLLNTISYFEKNQSLWEGFIYCGLLWILAIVIFIIYKKEKILVKIKLFKWNAIVYGVIGLLTVLFGEGPGNFSGILFIMLSIYIFNNKYTNIIILIIILFALTLRATINEYSIKATIALFSIHIFCIIGYFKYWHKVKPRILDAPELDDITAEILEYIVIGYQPKEIAKELTVSLSVNAINKRIQRACQRFNCKTSSHLIYVLCEKGYFRRK